MGAPSVSASAFVDWVIGYDKPGREAQTSSYSYDGVSLGIFQIELTLLREEMPTVSSEIKKKVKIKIILGILNDPFVSECDCIGGCDVTR